MKYITKRNNQQELFDESKIAKSLVLAYQSAYVYIASVYAYYIKNDKNHENVYTAALDNFKKHEINNIITDVKSNKTITTSKDITKYLIKYCNDKITAETYWYDALALSLSLQDITHEVCESFDLENYQEALTTCIERGIPFAGVQTIRSRYLQKDEKGKIIENINQALFLVDTSDFNKKLKDHHIKFFTDELNEKYNDSIKSGHFIHSTPTLLNHKLLGEKRQMSSCTQVHVEDTTEGVLKAFGAVCQYSRRAAGLGLHITKIREKGANIAGRKSSGGGVVSALKMFEQAIQHFDQQGQRGGALASYLNVLHPDIIDYLSSQDLGGQDDQRLHKIQLGVCIPDLFVKAVLNEEDVYLISPTTGLYEYAGKEFEQMYIELVNQGKYIKKTSALNLLLKMLSNQRAKSLFFFFRDTVFEATGEVHDGSNLCTEMILRTDAKYDGICNLGSINAYKIVKDCLLVNNNTNELINEITKKIKDTAKNASLKLLDITQLTVTPTQKGSRFNRDIPTIGLGIMGLTQAIDLLTNDKRIEKWGFKGYQDIIFDALYKGSNNAKEFWEYIHNKKVGRLRTIAPTESISVILGCTSAAEFPISKTFIKEINKTDIKIIYPFYKGKLAYELNTAMQIDFAAGRQAYLDHSQSINLFLSDKKYKQGVQSLREDITKQKEKIKLIKAAIKNHNKAVTSLELLKNTNLFNEVEGIYHRHAKEAYKLTNDFLIEKEHMENMENIINDMQRDADKHISNEQMNAFLSAWKRKLLTLYYLRKEDTRYVTACESCAG